MKTPAIHGSESSHGWPFSETPMRGHPVFIAQHACACCCRDCLAKWWKVPRGVAIHAERQQGIVDFLMAWIGRENA